LRVRAEVRARRERAELLEMLVKAAEEIGDLNRAISMERTRMTLLSNASDRQAAQGRLQQLLEEQKRTEGQPKSALVIDRQLVGNANERMR